MHHRLAFYLAVLVATAIAGLQHAVAGPYGQFGDWTVVCSNGLTCTMSAERIEGEAISSFGVARSAEPRSSGEIVFWDGPGMPAEPVMLNVAVDGVSVLRLPFADGAKDGEWRFSGQDDLEKLVQAMMEGSALAVTVEGKADTARQEVSLSGVTASVLFIDEAQARLDRPDAWRAKGERAIPARAVAADIETMDDLPAGVLADFTDDGLCGPIEDLNDDVFRYRGAFRANYHEGGELIGVPCGRGGAYNQLFTFYAGRDGGFRPVALPEMTDQGPSTTPFAFNASYDPVNSRLSAFYKARGLGDCGGYSVWQIGSGSGLDLAAFTLLEARVKGDCDGDYAGGPENWPLVWPRP